MKIGTVGGPRGKTQLFEISYWGVGFKQICRGEFKLGENRTK